MRRQVVRAWICVAVCCGGAQAEDQFPWEADAFSSSPEATLQAAAQLTPPEDAKVDILLDETKLEFDASRRVRKTRRRVYRLLTKEALDEWSVVNAEWSPWHEERPRLEARVISTDGQAHSLDAATISEAPVEQSGQVFSDRRRLVAPLPAVEVGAVVEWRIMIAEHRAFCDAGQFEEHYFIASNPVRSMRLIVEAPEQGPPLHQRVRGIELTPKRSAENGLVRLEFGPLPVGTAEGVEGYLPSDMPFFPHAVIGNGSAWADVAQHYAKIVDLQIGEAPYVEIARGIVGDEQSRLAIVRKLLDAVQQRVRYVGIEFGESSIVPHSPQETLKLRYGDCKDQSTLLVALLRSLGHSAHVALLRAGRKEELLADVPAMNAFDHAIVYVPGDPPLWIDPTAPLLRVGELPMSDKGRLALIASPDTTDLVRTPEPQSADNRVIRTRELVLAIGNRGRLRASTEYHGKYENEMRSHYAENKPDELRSDLEQSLKQAYGIERLSEFKCLAPRDLTAAFQICYEADSVNHGVRLPACSVSLDPQLILDDIPWPLRQNDSEETWKRSAPLQFFTPFVNELRYRVMLPIGFMAPKLPDSFTKQFGPVTISASFAQEAENLVTAAFRFDSGSGRLSPDEAEALREFLRQLRGESGEKWSAAVELEHAASQHIAQGRIRAGLMEYQRLLVQHPADMETRTWYVESLVSAGMGAAAREEARLCTELDAKSSQAWQSLGYARMYDDFGRFMGPGCDPFAAEAAFRKAVEIDPKYNVARWNLAVALEYGSGPRRYVLGPRLDESAELYNALRDEGYSEANLPSNLLLTLAYADNWQKLLSLIGEFEPSLLRNAMWVAATAAGGDVAAAQGKAVELAESDEARRQLLLNAGDLLNNTRHYAASAELIEHALTLITDPEERKRLQEFAAGVKVLSRIEEKLLPKENPGRLVQQLYAAAFSESAAESVSPLFVAEATPADVSAALGAIRRRYFNLMRSARESQKTSQRMADVASLLELKSEGNADAGHRVVAGAMRWYIVTQNGELRLLPPGSGFEELGRQALGRLGSNDEDGARRWLQWAAAELPPPAAFFADPFSASPFGFLWNLLKADHLQVAAAVLAAPGGKSDEALRMLSEFQQTATSKSQLLQIDRALARTYARRNDWQRLLELAERVQETYKWAEEPREWKLLALTNLNRVDELRELEQQRYSKMKGGARAWAEAFAAGKRGDFDLSRKLLRPLADDPSAEADPVVFNELAWNALFGQEAPTEAALADAVKANQGSGYRSSEYLHTLATVHAELEHPVEARKFLMQSIEVRDGEKRSEDVYVLGRIAESYGLIDAAAMHYAQVEPDAAGNSTYRLAQRRLKQLPGR